MAYWLRLEDLFKECWTSSERAFIFVLLAGIKAQGRHISLLYLPGKVLLEQKTKECINQMCFFLMLFFPTGSSDVERNSFVAFLVSGAWSASQKF